MLARLDGGWGCSRWAILAGGSAVIRGILVLATLAPGCSPLSSIIFIAAVWWFFSIFNRIVTESIAPLAVRIETLIY